MKDAADVALVVLTLGMFVLLGVIVGAKPTSRTAARAMSAYAALIALSGCVRREWWQIGVGAAMFAAIVLGLPWLARRSAARIAALVKRGEAAAALAPEEPCRCEFCQLPDDAKEAGFAEYEAAMRVLGFPTKPKDAGDVLALHPIVTVAKRTFVAGVRWGREHPEAK